MSASDLESLQTQRIFRLPLLLVLCGSLGLAQGLFAQEATDVKQTERNDKTIVETVSTLDPQIPGQEQKSSDLMSYFSGSPDHFTQQDAQALYRTTCQACHMADGKGAEGAGAYPPLAGNPKLLSKHYIVSVLLTGYHGMPRFGDQMSNEQVAAVSNFVRNAFGNDFPGEVTAEDVEALRPPASMQAEGGGH